MWVKVPLAAKNVKTRFLFQEILAPEMSLKKAVLTE